MLEVVGILPVEVPVSILIRSCVLPSGKVTDMSISLPRRCMWGTTAWAIRSTGTGQAAWISMLEFARQLHVDIQGGVPVHDLADRLAGEPQADPRAVHFRLAAGMIVNLDDHIGVAGQSDRPMPSSSWVGWLPGAQPPRSP